MKILGTHVICDMIGVDDKWIDNCRYTEYVSKLAAIAAGATVLSFNHHRFEPQGLTTATILAESHVATHSYPELGNRLSVDMYTCGDCDPIEGINIFIRLFQPKEYNIQKIIREI